MMMTLLKDVWRRIADAQCARGQAVRVCALRVALVALTGLLPGLGLAEDADPVLSSHVTDHAQILGVSGANLDSKLRAFEAASGHQVFVLTVPTTGARPIDQYAVAVFQKWKLGRAGVDNGVLFVVALADHRMRFEVGYGLEGILTDAKCSRIIRETVAPEFAKGRYDTGVEAGLDAVLLALSPPQSASSPNDVQRAQSTPSVASQPAGSKAALAFIGLVLTGLVLLTTDLACAGLLIFALFALMFSALPLPGLQGKLLFMAAISAWLCARWLSIAKNVREHHLPGSRNHLLTWLWVLFFTRGSGNPSDSGKPSALSFSVSFTGSDSGKCSASDESDSSGHGGKSGGGGATGQW